MGHRSAVNPLTPPPHHQPAPPEGTVRSRGHRRETCSEIQSMPAKLISSISPPFSLISAVKLSSLKAKALGSSWQANAIEGVGPMPLLGPVVPQTDGSVLERAILTGGQKKAFAISALDGNQSTGWSLAAIDWSIDGSWRRGMIPIWPGNWRLTNNDWPVDR